MRFFYFISLVIFVTACQVQGSESNLPSFFSGTEAEKSSGDAQESPLKAGNYVRWIENKEHGLKVSKELSDYRFMLQYKPLDYVLLNHFKSDKVDKKEWLEKHKEFEGLRYFTFRIEAVNSKDILKAGIADPNEQAARLDYFAFRMQNDLSLVEGQDTLKCVLYHYERSYGITPYTDFILGFEERKGKIDKMTDMTFVMEDAVLGTGTVKLKVKEEDLKRIPKLISPIQ